MERFLLSYSYKERMAKKSLLGVIFGKKAKPKRRIKVARKKIIIRKKKPAARKPAERKIIKRKIKAEKRKEKIKAKRIKVEQKIKARKIPTKALAKLPDERALEVLKSYGIPVTQHFFVKKEPNLLAALKRTGFPCVMKVSGAIIHKTDVGGVKIINTEDEAKAAFSALKKIRGCEKVLVQKFCSGIETIVGTKWDEQFGQIVVFGLGGIYAEVLKDVSFRVCPITQEDAESMVKEIKGYEILTGARGQKPINFQALYDVLMKVSRLATKEKIKEMDINPLFCSSEGCLAADVRIMKR